LDIQWFRGEVFIAANEEPVFIIDMGKSIKALGKDIRVIRLPIGPFFLAADICKALCIPLGIQPSVSAAGGLLYQRPKIEHS
jgi:dihydroflavonol-4-reductase